MPSFFFLQDSSHHSFTFNLQLYKLKHKVRLSKIGSGISQFRFRSVFIEVYTFVQQDVRTL